MLSPFRHLLLTVVSSVALARVADAAPPKNVDASTLTGKVMCGYQGWFTCDGDGSELGWVHWSKNRREAFGPGNVTVDLWPDVSEYSDAELFDTGFRHADGRVARVFSSHHRDTVVRHFQWMQDYGIDGAFVQRFANGMGDEKLREHKDAVLSHAREGARLAGRAYAVMYDLSGLKAGGVASVIDDWKKLRAELKLTEDKGYLHHQGSPVVAVWGIGFNDDRQYSLQECRELIEFLKDDGCTVMLGVPSWWREGKRDATDDPELHNILKLADILSPWTVTRYQTAEQAQKHSREVWRPDLQWCRENEIDFLPVVFPGFSWANLKDKQLNLVPREKGTFLWSQIAAAKRIGCDMIYVAMFDEVDEGTAIFKCTNDIPVGEGVTFLDYEGLPSDFYLRLTGEAGKLLRGEISVNENEVLPTALNSATDR